MIESSSSSSSSSPPSSSPSSPAAIENPTRKEVVKARWGILRNALLQSEQQDQYQRQHSIHRFSGYNLLEARLADSNTSFAESESIIRRIEPLLTQYRWDSVRTHGSNSKIDRLEIAILALAACFPKGKCIRIISAVANNNDDNDCATATSFTNASLESIKMRCRPSICVWKVSEGLEELEDANKQTPLTIMVTTLLVQESSTSTKYQALVYDLEGVCKNSRENLQNDSKENNTLPSYSHIIWTREPRENRLSLDDLVSHRKNNGVDNTGNICVWDSERTLAYLLYHHFDDFFTQTASDTKNTTPVRYDAIIHPQVDGTSNRSKVCILELGTGMAGLSAVALGLRLAMQQQEHGGNMIEDKMSDNDNIEINEKAIHVTLTDGNPSGVKNNVVNQYLTKLYSQMMKRKGNYSHYLDLDVDCETLLWTTDLDCGKHSLMNQDIVLISDCVHFQNFHAALATTTLRCLRVGGRAVFCQPTRGPSLDNFFNLLLTATSDTDTIDATPLLSYNWLSHPIIEQNHHKARLHQKNVYDENLHKPKILVVTKLREISEEDKKQFLAFQCRYSPTTPTTIEKP